MFSRSTPIIRSCLSSRNNIRRISSSSALGLSSSPVKEPADDLSALMQSVMDRSAAKKQHRKNVMDEIEKFSVKSRSNQSQHRKLLNTARIQWRQRFSVGDTYAPEDLIEGALNAVNQRQQRQSSSSSSNRPTSKWQQDKDIFTKFNISPASEYKNAALLSEYVNDIGQVLPRSKTGVSASVQRQLVKTLNHAVHLGIIPRSKKHPDHLHARSRFQ